MAEQLPLTVLLVEDEAINRKILSRILIRFVSQVWEAENGVEALERVEDLSPDVVITDLSMPKMDGLTLIRELRSRGRDLPVVVLSAHNEAQILAEAGDAGMFRFLFKPVNIEALTLALGDIAGALGHRAKNRKFV